MAVQKLSLDYVDRVQACAGKGALRYLDVCYTRVLPEAHSHTCFVRLLVYLVPFKVRVSVWPQFSLVAVTLSSAFEQHQCSDPLEEFILL